MANLPAGDYRIVCAAATSLSLDVSGGPSMASATVGQGFDGQNIQVWTTNYSDAQVFNVSYREDGTAQILARWCAKSVDAEGGNLVSGTNVQMWTDNDTRAQQWAITDLGETLSIGGNAYPLYKVCPSEAPTLCWDAAWGSSGSVPSAGSNVYLNTYSNLANKKWVFVPVEPFKSGGIYELHSMVNTDYCLDVASASKANGANVQVYIQNHTNAQKWVAVQESDGWSFRNVASGKYMDVDGASFANDVNVQSYQDNDTRAQRWSVTTYGTVELDGSECAVAEIGADNARDFLLSNAASANSNAIIWEFNGFDDQRWALFPTWAEDEFMPSPFNLGITEGEASVPWASEMALTVHPTWECAPAYATSGPNGYQVRYRTRKMPSSLSTWRQWTGWTAWKTAAVTKDGRKSVLTQGIPLSMTDSYKAMQLEWQVRATGVDELALLYGATATHTVTLCPKPTVDFPSATMGSNGLSIGYESAYNAGGVSVYLDGLVIDGHNVLKRPIAFTALDSTETLDVPMEYLSTIPASGDQVTVRYGLGTDVMPRFKGTLADEVAVSYGSGGTTVSPTFERDGYDLTATFPDEGDTRVWVSAGSGVVECTKVSTSGGTSTFDVPFPMGTEYRIFATGHSGTSWFAWTGLRTETATPAHVWDFGGGRAVLEVRQGTPPTTNDGIDADSETWLLSARDYETVGFSGTRKHRFTANGAVTERTDSNRSDFELLAGTHAVYRSPAGDVVNVAVLSVDRESHHNWTEISVTMARESE